MKIVFDSENERDYYVGLLTSGEGCPSSVSLPNSTNCDDCYDCWFEALKPISEVKPNGQG